MTTLKEMRENPDPHGLTPHGLTPAAIPPQPHQPDQPDQPYLGAIRSAPSRRITSPFSISFSMM